MALKNEKLIDSVIAAFEKQTGLSIYPDNKNSAKDSVFLIVEGK